MSASLVGSEMCIRDRVATRARLPQRNAAEQAAPSTSSRLPETLALSSVSYTHLTLPTICSV
eukprot:13032331-Alexandrium_andersonii.AAC.1